MKNVEDLYPLSPLQEVFLYHVLSASGRAGFEQKITTLRGEIDLQAFERTWQQVVARHTILRTSFLWEGLERPLQVVRRSVEVPIQMVDLRGLGSEEQRRRVAAFCQADLERGFDVRRAPLLRLALLQRADDLHELVWSYHHLVLDAWCRSLVLQEVFQIYDAARNGRPAALPPPRPFREYIAWIERQDLGRAETFWRRTLGGSRVPTPFGIDRMPERRLSSGTLSASHWLPGEPLRAFARRHRLTPNVLVQGAWGLLLSRLSGRRDVVFGATVSGRPADLPGIESMVGMFINNLPVRVEAAPEAAALDWLQQLREQAASLHDYEFCSPVQVRAWSGMAGGQRLYESLLLFQNYPIPRSLGIEVQGEVAIGPMQSRMETGYPLTLRVVLLDELQVEALYDGERFDALSIRRMLGHLAAILQELMDRPQAPLADLSMLSGAERHQVLVEWGSRGTLLDRDGQGVPMGLPGELHVAGSGTRELGRWSPDGRIELLGNLEERIEIGGHLVSPGEIEALLESHPGVQRAAVLPRPMASGRVRLVAYLAGNPASPPGSPELRRHLRRSLPEPLIPTAFATLEELPLREDGRIDRGRIPALGRAARLQEGHSLPRSPLELRLVRIWEELLDLQPIGTTDDFFDLGGDSSLAVQLVHRVRGELDRSVPLTTLLQSRTVRSLARALEDLAEEPAPSSPLVEIQPGEAGAPLLFCIHPGGGGVLCYVDLAYCLGPRCPVYGLKARGWEDGQEPCERIEEMASSYIEAIRKVQPAGPYHLAGWSFGALVALEMAQQLRQAGEEIGLLASLDAGILSEGIELDDADVLREFLGDSALELLGEPGIGLTTEELRRRGGIDEQISYLLDAAKLRDLLPSYFDLARMRRLFEVRKASFKAAARYQPRPYDGRVTLFRATEGRILFHGEPTLGWHRVARGGLEIHEVAGTHEALVRRPWVADLAERLRSSLEPA